MQSASNYRSGRHCVFALHVHLVFTPKYRRHVFLPVHLDCLREVFSGVATEFDAALVEFNGESDHVHLLLRYPPQVELSRLINSLKGVSSRKLRRQHPDIQRHYWGNSTLWSRSYFAASCGGASLEVLHDYIAGQRVPT